MESYKQVLKKVELALVKGEYYSCIEYLLPKIKEYPLSSKEGGNLRTIIITALCGINKKDEAKKFCKELLKSPNHKVREDAKYLMEVIDSPEIKKPDNWNIKFENNITLNTGKVNKFRLPKNIEHEKKFINTSSLPTGETEPFQKGFIFLIFLFLILLTTLLSGCVKIENTLDISEVNSIQNHLSVESKYINKFPWQINFEKKIKKAFPDSKITIGDLDFSINNNNLDLVKTRDVINTIQNTAAELANGSTKFEISNTEKNLFLMKKYNYDMNFDLQNIPYTEDLELNFKVITPNKVSVSKTTDPQLEVSKNVIKWILIPGQINSLGFSFWDWNKLLIGSILILFIVSISYLIKFYRYQIGSDLPKLPSGES